jgi:hypothetical protein
MLLLEKNPEKTWGKTKISILLKSNNTYNKFVANESSFGIYTQKTKEILFEFDNVFKILYV